MSDQTGRRSGSGLSDTDLTATDLTAMDLAGDSAQVASGAEPAALAGTGSGTVAGPPSGGADLGGAARNGMIALLGSAVAAVAGLLLNVVIGRGLGAAGSGVFFVVVAVLTVVSTITKLGADTGLVWAIARARALDQQRDVRRILWTGLWPSIVVSAVSAVALFLAAPWLAELIGDSPDLERMFRVSAPFLLVAGPCMVLAAGLRGAGSIVGYTGVQNILVPGLRPILAAAAVAAGLGVTSAIVTWNLPLVLGLVIAALLVVRRTQALERAHPGAAPLREHAVVSREFWRFSGPRAVAAALEVALTWTDVLIVAAVATPREAGIYAAASRFITTGTLAEGALRVAMAPEVSRLLSLGDLPSAAKLCSTVTQWTVLLSWPLYLVLALYSPAILSVFGAEFRDGALALTILATAMLLVMSAGNNQTILLMSGRSGMQMANRGAELAGNIALNAWMVPHWGMNGAAAAWAITWVADSLLVLSEVRWAVGLQRSWARVWPAIGMAATAFVPVGLAIRIWAGDGVLESLAGVVVSVVLFGVLLRLNRDRLDIDPVRQALRRR